MSKLFLVSFLIFLFSSSIFTYQVQSSSFQNQSDSELVFYSSSIAVTPLNVSIFTATSIPLGMIYGGNHIYQFQAYLSEKSSLTLFIGLNRDFQGISFSLNPNFPFWGGNISFSGCCASVLKTVTASFSIQGSTAGFTANKTLFRLDFAINILPIPGYQGSVLSGKLNALGYPYPSRIFITGLMITLLGTIPEAIIVKLLMRFTRKQHK